MLFSRKSSMIISFVFAMVFMFIVPSIDVEAKELVSVEESNVVNLEMSDLHNLENKKEIGPSTRALLYNCLINVTPGSNGMHVSFVTDCVQTASTIGVKDIKIEQRVWYGWKTVATSSGGSHSNSTSYMGEILYTGAVYGESYRISCVHYANADVYTELANEVQVNFVY